LLSRAFQADGGEKKKETGKGMKRGEAEAKGGGGGGGADFRLNSAEPRFAERKRRVVREMKGNIHRRTAKTA